MKQVQKSQYYMENTIGINFSMVSIRQTVESVVNITKSTKVQKRELG